MEILAVILAFMSLWFSVCAVILLLKLQKRINSVEAYTEEVKQYFLKEVVALNEEDSALRIEIAPIKSFMAEHSKNIVEAEREYVESQKMFSDGIQGLLKYDYGTALKKHGES